MRQALRQNRAKAQTAILRSLPAPIGGWDTESALNNMPPQNAVILDNWIARGGYVQHRPGFTDWCTGSSDPVETLVTWGGDSTGDKIFACAGSGIFDVTTQQALPSAAYASAASARWNWTNLTNSAGRFVIMLNGEQTPLKYDGSSFATTAFTGTGLTAADLKYLMVFGSRLHMVMKDSMIVWVGDIDAIAGALSTFNLGGVFSKGGYIVALGRLTIDGGNGPDDYAVYVTNRGQVAIYSGTDPTDATNWRLVGIYNIAAPLGDRCLVQSGTDLLVLTKAGVLSLTTALRQPLEEQRKNSLTRRIATAFATAAGSYGDNFGWEAIAYSGRGGLIIVNVPTTELSVSQQYVVCLEGMAASRFTGIDAFCWGEANGAIFFGSTLGVYRWDQGASDNGETIVSDMLPAFSAFGSRVSIKDFTMVRALLRAPAIVTPALQVVADFDKATIPTAIPTVVTPSDISPDDSDVIRTAWTGAAASGYYGAPRMRIDLSGAATSDRLAITEDDASLLYIESGGPDHLLTRPDLPLDVDVQCVGFDMMFQAGGAL